MKSLLTSKRSKAILGIGVFGICIGAISKKVISYPAGGWMKDTQEMTLTKKKTIKKKSLSSSRTSLMYVSFSSLLWQFF